MSQDEATPLEGAALDDVEERIRGLQREIDELDEKISRKVDELMTVKLADPPAALKDFMSAMEGSTGFATVQHLLRIKEDWDVLYTRICAFNEDDEELLEGLIPCIGDLLLDQPEGIDERWVHNLEEFLVNQRAKVS
ncbi:MAG TPA: hypothetical protein VGG06_36640 [Thermoanaerobaculia bacterium]|jgi:hypothetical protein